MRIIPAVSRYACGHIGRMNMANDSRRSVKGFIRVGEIRGATVLYDRDKCPNCKGR